jgi:hypothetical protein
VRVFAILHIGSNPKAWSTLCLVNSQNLKASRLLISVEKNSKVCLKALRHFKILAYSKFQVIDSQNFHKAFVPLKIFVIYSAKTIYCKTYLKILES